MNVSINSAFEIALQTAASLYEGMPAKLLLLVVLGVLCFAGYRLLHWASALYGALAGVCLGVGLTGVLGSLGVTNGGLALSSAAMLVLGIVLGVVAYRVTHVGIFLACGAIGALVGYVPGAFANEVFAGGLLLVLLVCFVLFGVTGVLFQMPAYLIATSLSGIPAGMVLAQLLGVESAPISVLLGVVLTAAGFAVQTLLPRRAEEKLQKEEEAMQDTDPHLPIAEEPEEPDTIDTISDTVAQHIDLSAPAAPHFFFPEQPEEAEEAGDHTMAIPKQDVPQEPEKLEQPDEPEEADTRTMILSKSDWEQAAEPEEKRSIFDLFSEKKEETSAPAEPVESSEPVEPPHPSEPESVLAEERPAETADKFTLEELLAACDEDANAVKRAEQPEQEKETPEQPQKPKKSELTPEEKEQRKQNVLTAVFAVVIVAASIVFAALGVQHVEVLLALCFCMYLGERYRLAAFGFAVLAVRRLYDAAALLVQGGQLMEALTDAVIGATFIILTLHMLRTYTSHKHADEETEETEE